jgi:hypothetical protein
MRLRKLAITKRITPTKAVKWPNEKGPPQAAQRRSESTEKKITTAVVRYMKKGNMLLFFSRF